MVWSGNGGRLRGQLWLQLSWDCSQLLATAAIIWKFNGAGGLASTVASSHSRQIQCWHSYVLGWEEVSVPPHLALFRRHLECPLDMVADFLRSKKSKREPQDLLWYILRSHTPSFAQYPTGFTDRNYSMSQSVVGGLYKSVTTRGSHWGQLGGQLEG